MKNKNIEKKAMAFEVANIISELNGIDANSIYLIAQVLLAKQKQEKLKEQQNKEKN